MSDKALTDEPPTPVPPPSAPAITHRTSSRTKLTFPGIANLFVGLKRAQSRASINAAKAGIVHSDSGEAPITHAALETDGGVSPRQVPIEQEDVFVCAGGVDTVKLVRLVRETVLQSAVAIGANVLVNERWSCDIHEPKRGDGNYRAHIRYTASAARSSKPDPRKPVALENAKSVPGLMTVVQRHSRI